MRLLVAWYLTEDDLAKNKSDGNKRQYLEEEDNDFYQADPALWEWLKSHHTCRSVYIVETSKILGEKTSFHNVLLSKNVDRDKWFNGQGGVLEASKKADIVFLDPDNGIKYNSKKSVKHVYISEIRKLWKAGKSLIVYQHAPYIDQEVFVYGTMMKLFKELEENPFIATVKSSHVMYFFVLRREHAHCFEKMKSVYSQKWEGLFVFFDYTLSQYKNQT